MEPRRVLAGVPLKLEYTVTPQPATSNYKYDFALKVDSSAGTYAAGQGWGFVVFGHDAANVAPSLTVFTPTTAAPSPFTAFGTTSSGYSLAPLFGTYWIPANINSQLAWSGTSTADVAQGQLYFDAFTSTGGAASFSNAIATRLVATPVTTVSLVGGNLTFTDGSNASDNVTIAAQAGGGWKVTSANSVFSAGSGLNANYVVSGNTVTIAAGATFTNFNVLGAGGDDTLTVNLATPLNRSVSFDGGSGGHDSLKTVGGTFTTGTHTLTGTVANPGSGTLLLDSTSISYSNLEPVDTSATTIANLVFNLPAGTVDAELRNDAGNVAGVSALAFASGSQESQVFANPASSLSVSTGGSSVVKLFAMDGAFNPASMTLAGTSNDRFVLQSSQVIPDAATVLVSGGKLELNSQAETIGTLTGTGSVDVSGGTLSVGSNNTNHTFGGTLIGSGNVVKTGTGKWTLGGNNTFTGTMTVAMGTLEAATNLALGLVVGGTEVLTDATLRLASGVNIGAEPLTLAGNGDSGSGALQSFGGTLSGPVQIASPRQSVGLQNATAIRSQSGFPVSNMIDGNNATGWSNNGAGSNTAVFETNSDLNTGGVLSEVTAKISSGGGSGQTLGKFRLSVTFSARNTFADGLANGGAVSASWIPVNVTSVQASNGTTLTLLGDNSILASGAIPASDVYTVKFTTSLPNITGIRLEALTDASLPATGPGRNPASGNFVVDDFSVSIVSEAMAKIVSDSGTLQVSGPVASNVGLANVTFAGAGSTNVSGIVGSVAPSIMNVIKEGTGNLSLSGNNTYLGTTTIRSGTLTVGSNNALGSTAGGTSVLSGATLAFTGGVSVGPEPLVVEAVAAGSSPALLNQAGFNSFAGAVSLVPPSVGTASDLNLQASAGGLTMSGPVTLGSSVLTVSGTGNLTISGDVSQSGPSQLVKNSAGDLTMSGNNSLTGPTTINTGTLVMNGSLNTSPITIASGVTLAGTGTTGPLTIQSGGYHTPGMSPGITTVNGDYVENGTLQVEFLNASQGPGIGFDQVKVVGNGSVSLGAGAVLNLSFLGTAGTFAPANGQVFTIIDNDGSSPADISGTFTGLPAGSTVMVDGKPLRIFYNGNDGNDVVLVAETGVPAELFVNDQWSVSSMVDGNLELAGIQAAYVGINAFGSIAAALGAYPSFAGNIVVNGGSYAQGLLAGGGGVTLSLAQDLANSEADIWLQNLSGDANDAIATRDFGSNANLHLEQGSFSGIISGAGNVFKATSGVLTLSGNGNTYSGSTSISGGVVYANNASGSATGTGNVTVQNGELRGTGSLSGTVTTLGTSIIGPGNVTQTPASLGLGATTMAVGTTLELQIASSASYDQLVVNGAATLTGNVELTLPGSYVPVSGDSFMLINTSAGVLGTGKLTFGGVPLLEGDSFLYHGQEMAISYLGGTDGHDVVINAKSSPVIQADLLGPPQDNQIVVKRSAGNLLVIVDGVTQVNLPFSSVLALTIDAGFGSDNLVIDYSSGSPIPNGGITFVGGNGGDGAQGDRLTLQNGNANLVSYTFSNNHDGDVTIDGKVIQYTGLEPIIDNLSAVNRTFSYLGGTETISWTVAGGMNQIDSTLGESVSFGNPLSSLSIDMGSGDDLLQISSVLAGFSAALSIDGGLGNDSVILNAAIALGSATSTGDLTVVSESISSGAAAAITTQIGTGNISLTGNSILLSAPIDTSLATVGNLVQTAGTATTTLNGATLKGNLLLNTGNIILQSGVFSTGGLADLNTSSGGVNQVAGTFTSPSLRLRGSNNFSLSSVTNNFGTLSANVTGNLTVVDTGSLTTGTISGTVGVTSSSGNVSLRTVDSGVAGDNLVIAAGNPISAASGFVLLNAGDDLLVNAPITAGTTVTGNVDVADADGGTGGVFTLAGSVGVPVAITAPGGTFLNGNTDNDTFNVYAQTTTAFSIDGDLPVGTLTGDVLAMSVVGTGATLTVGGTAPYNGPGSGTWTFAPSFQSIRFKSIEDSQITGSYHLTYDFANSAPVTTDLFVMRDVTTAKLQLRDGSNAGPILFQANLAPNLAGNGVLSLKVLGTGNNESVTVDDINTLPVFAAAVPGTPDNAILAGQASLLFQGAGGTNKLNFALTGANIAQTYAIGNGAGVGSEGEVQTVSGAGVLNAYFTGLGPAGSVNRTGGNANPGSLTILGDNLGNTINVTGVAAVTNINPVTYTPFNYSASGGTHSYSALNLAGLGGNDTLNMQGFGSSVANDPTILLDGGNNDDILQVGSTSGNLGAISILGQSGNDTIRLYTDGLNPSGANRSDLISGKVTVDGGAASDNDQLFLVALTNSSALTNVQITSTTIDNVTPAASTDVTFSNINLLDVTTTNLADTITTTLTAPSVNNDLAVVTVHGGDSSDQFYLHIPVTPTNTPAGLTNINLLGDAGDDYFGSNADRIIPAYSKASGADIFINGGTPDLPAFDPVSKNSIDGDKLTGDRIYLDMSSATAPVIVDTVTGFADSASHRRLVYNGIEDIDLYDNAGQLQNVHQGSLYMRATEGSDYLVLMGLTGGKVRIRANNAYYGDYAPVTKLVVHARGGNDYIATSAMPANLPLELYGDEGDDSITGSAAGDLIVGGEGLDRLSGGAGGVDEIWGDVFNPITVDPNLDIMLDPTNVLAIGIRASQVDKSTFNSLGGPAANPSTDGNDIITTAQGNGADRIYGQGGNDIVTASAQDDVIYGGDGIDNLSGANGNDRIYGNAGNDNLAGEGGDDFLFGGDGNDTLNGGLGNDVLVGGIGQDILRGDQNRDMVIGGTISYSGVNSGTADSKAYGDTNDVAMLELLNNWRLAVAPSIPFTGLTVTNDGEIDSLSGGDSADDFYNEAVDLLIDYLPTTGDRKTP
ncbi:MAG: autotransporter-associated beta strand repeat-containing protein [Pirellulales bacterium]